MEEADKKEILKQFITIRQELLEGKVICYCLKGALDYKILPALTDIIVQELQNKNYRLIFNMSEVESILPGSLGIIWFKCKEACKSNGDFKFVALNEVVAAAFRRMSLYKYMEFFDTEEEAVKSFQDSLDSTA